MPARQGIRGQDARAPARQASVHLGAEGAPVGQLRFIQQGRRQFTDFAYETGWLSNPARFEVSPDLPLQAGHQVRKAAGPDESVFHAALADTAPDAWGRRVIERARAKARRDNPRLPPLNEWDCLCAVDDFSRVGALRLQVDGRYVGAAEAGRRSTPPFIELQRLYAATRAVETDQETAEDLAYLQGRGTSLGGMRPKCTLLDEDGWLAIGKFPSVGDQVCVTRAEVLALQLARMAGIRVAESRCVTLAPSSKPARAGRPAIGASEPGRGSPVAVIRRFDRLAGHQRVPYLSAASLLQAARHEDRAYTELVDELYQRGSHPLEDSRELWRRLVFNLLITNTDDHLHNCGLLYDGQGRWRLAPAFDLNPMPGKLRESKTWLSEDTGPIDDLRPLMSHSARFGLDGQQAKTVVGQVLSAVAQWRTVGQSAAVGMTTRELEPFSEAFDHPQTALAMRLAEGPGTA